MNVLLFYKMETVGDAFDSLHPDASCSPWVVVGPGRMIFPDSIVNARVRLGANVIINRGPVVGHDCVGEDYVHVGACARLASGIRVGGFS
ncbi:MAG: hypothetical protein KKD99_13115 [Proteobacteria bacterium]|nr:hypothetical protein [Pseudomonadota bacterium]MBU4449519.1 hypothetical protein [Pseudomonadota bacterium]